MDATAVTWRKECAGGGVTSSQSRDSVMKQDTSSVEQLLGRRSPTTSKLQVVLVRITSVLQRYVSRLRHVALWFLSCWTYLVVTLISPSFLFYPNPSILGPIHIGRLPVQQIFWSQSIWRLRSTDFLSQTQITWVVRSTFQLQTLLQLHFSIISISSDFAPCVPVFLQSADRRYNFRENSVHNNLACRRQHETQQSSRIQIFNIFSASLQANTLTTVPQFVEGGWNVVKIVIWGGVARMRVRARYACMVGIVVQVTVYCWLDLTTDSDVFGMIRTAKVEYQINLVNSTWYEEVH